MGLSERLLDLLFPRTCADCRLDLPPPLSGPLCGPCLRALRPFDETPCRGCGASLERRPSHRARCSEPLPSLDFVRAAFAYRRPVPGLLHAFKYEGRLPAGRALAGWMAGLYPRLLEGRRPDAVVPVPLHPSRLRERGFNQAEVLAAAVARTARVGVLNALERVRGTAPQWRLGRGQRLDNLRGAFRTRPGASVKGLSVLLVDDVCTTGGTLEACAKELRAAGADGVAAFVLARD